MSKRLGLGGLGRVSSSEETGWAILTMSPFNQISVQVGSVGGKPLTHTWETALVIFSLLPAGPLS